MGCQDKGKVGNFTPTHHSKIEFYNHKKIHFCTLIQAFFSDMERIEDYIPLLELLDLKNPGHDNAFFLFCDESLIMV